MFSEVKTSFSANVPYTQRDFVQGQKASHRKLKVLPAIIIFQQAFILVCISVFTDTTAASERISTVPVT